MNRSFFTKITARIPSRFWFVLAASFLLSVGLLPALAKATEAPLSIPELPLKYTYTMTINREATPLAEVDSEGGQEQQQMVKQVALPKEVKVSRDRGIHYARVTKTDGAVEEYWMQNGIVISPVQGGQYMVTKKGNLPVPYPLYSESIYGMEIAKPENYTGLSSPTFGEEQNRSLHFQKNLSLQQPSSDHPGMVEIQVLQELWLDSKTRAPVASRVKGLEITYNIDGKFAKIPPLPASAKKALKRFLREKKTLERMRMY